MEIRLLGTSSFCWLVAETDRLERLLFCQIAFNHELKASSDEEQQYDEEVSRGKTGYRMCRRRGFAAFVSG
ncbi:hypothetical protein T4D_247 [Trichinella pseudospiralis]|uniref:Uncharacterized protein n=1 Tax=Trichinella pseudospiralis TaxID=6337 RepID=A0A0V1FBC0_TRIPS|nr:hypothetical protein T4D_247 [Trichinella pseudospiralis]